MERRSFLKGLLIGASAASSTAMVKLATPDEIDTLVVGQNVALTGIETDPMRAHRLAVDAIHRNKPIYVELLGRPVQIGFLTQVSIGAPIDHIPTLDGEGIIAPDPSIRTFRFQGV